MIERSHLEIVREIGRKRTLTEAANTLHLSQSALSHAIRKLEQQINTRIWVKNGRLLQFTQAGWFLHDLAIRLLPQFEHAESTFSRIAAGKKGNLRIGMECHPCYQWLLKVVLPYLQQWREVDMDIKKDFRFDGLKALKNHEIDLLITPDRNEDDTLRFTPVFAYETMLIVDENHPLAVRRYVSPEDLITEKLLTFPVAKERLDIFNCFLLPAGCMVAEHQVMEDPDIMTQMVAAGRGITTMPDWLARDQVAALPVKALQLGESGMNKELFAVVRQSDLGIDYLTAFIRHAQDISIAS
jgi:LysR family transcriptional regulator, regulator for metE and metH